MPQYIWIHKKIFPNRIFLNYNIIHQTLIVFHKLHLVNHRQIANFEQLDSLRLTTKAKKH